LENETNIYHISYSWGQKIGGNTGFGETTMEIKKEGCSFTNLDDCAEWKNAVRKVIESQSVFKGKSVNIVISSWQLMK